MAQQPPLFDEITPAPAPSSRSLDIRAQPARPLTKSQKTLNRLVAQIEQRRKRLSGLQGALEALQAPHALTHVRVLIREQRAADKIRFKLPIRFPY